MGLNSLSAFSPLGTVSDSETYPLSVTLVSIAFRLLVHLERDKRTLQGQEVHCVSIAFRLLVHLEPLQVGSIISAKIRSQ